MACCSGPFISINNNNGNNNDLCFELFHQIVSFFVVLNIVGTQDLPQKFKIFSSSSEAGNTPDSYFDSVVSSEG